MDTVQLSTEILGLRSDAMKNYKCKNPRNIIECNDDIKKVLQLYDWIGRDALIEIFAKTEHSMFRSYCQAHGTSNNKDYEYLEINGILLRDVIYRYVYCGKVSRLVDGYMNITNAAKQFEKCSDERHFALNLLSNKFLEYDHSVEEICFSNSNIMMSSGDFNQFDVNLAESLVSVNSPGTNNLNGYLITTFLCLSIFSAFIGWLFGRRKLQNMLRKVIYKKFNYIQFSGLDEPENLSAITKFDKFGPSPVTSRYVSDARKDLVKRNKAYRRSALF